MKKLILLILTTTFLLATAKTSVIFMIGDGMGPAYTTAFRYYKDDNTSHKISSTVFDTILEGMNSTYSRNSVITDSAAAATALASGHKTDNGIIGLKTHHEEKIQTLLEVAKHNGYLTGLAATSTITHATPAAFIAKGGHLRNREAEIAKDFFKTTEDGKLKFDLLIGGGEKYFAKAFKDFNQTAKEYGLSLYRNGYTLEDIKHFPFIAFTSYDYPPFAIDESEENRYRVAKMTEKSLELLKDRPFFLMVESSQIDWCGHINDIACAMAEMDDFAMAVETAKAYVDMHPDTLLLVTADHSTGGLAIGDKVNKKDIHLSEAERDKTYTWYPQVIKKVKASSYAIAKALRESKDINATFKEYTSIILKQNEYREITEAIRNKDKKVRVIVNEIINRRSHTGWSTLGHTAVDVQTFAYGKGSQKFKGFMDNTDIAKKLFEVLSGK
jgi:alkaline phosphatase